MWPYYIFGLGMIPLLTFMYFGKLYKFKGTKFKTRMLYTLGLWFNFMLCFLWEGEMQGIGKSLLLGAVLFIPSCFYLKRWLKKRIEGTTVFYKRKQYRRRLSWVIPIAILPILVALLFPILAIHYVDYVDVDVGERILEAAILEANWLMLGLGFALFTSQIFFLLYIVKLERKLGTPILEDTK